MKKTYLTLLLRGVKKSFTRFLSIFAIVLLGVGFLSGLIATAPDMELTVDGYYDEYHTHDFDVKGTLGVTEKDLEAVRAIGGVHEAQLQTVTDALVENSAGESMVGRITGVDMAKMAAGEGIDGAQLLQGRWPQEEGECVVLAPSSYSYENRLGEIYVISEENKDYDKIDETYRVLEYKAVGVIKSPLYISVESEPSLIGNGSVGIVIYVDQSAYSLAAATDVVFTLEDALGINSFSEKYEKLLDEKSQALEQLGLTRSEERLAEVKADAEEELTDAKQKYTEKKTEAEEKLADAEQQIKEGEEKLADAEEQIEEGEEKLSNAKSACSKGKKQFNAQMSSANAALAQGRQQLLEQQAALDAQKPQLEALKAALDAAKPGIDALKQLAEPRPQEAQKKIDEFDRQTAEYESANAALEQGTAGVQEGFAALEEREASLAKAKSEGEVKLRSAARKLEKAEQELADAKQELIDGQQELADAKKEYTDKKREADEKLADAAQKISDAEQEIEELETPKWVVLDRRDNVSYSSYQGNVEKIEAIARVFPVFFFVVAALVALTTMTRMVEEERTQIGTLKALGYSDGSILFYYLGYSGLASVLGSAAGGAIGFWVLPRVISSAYAMMYTIPKVIAPFWWSYLLLVAPIAVGLTMASTLFACLGELKERPASLLLPKAPKAGKRVFLEKIGFIWKRMSFTKKVTARNLLRYKKRFYMTVIGIAGCTALLVTGFGLRDSIGDIVEKQFAEINRYNLTMYVKNNGDAESDNMISDFLKSEKAAFSAQIHEEKAYALAGEDEERVTLTVPKETEQLKEAFLLRERVSKKDVPFSNESVVLTEKLAEQLGLKAGDSFTVRLEAGDTASFTVTGIAENYIYSRAYLSAQTYARAFSKAPEYKTVLIRLADESKQSRDAVSTELLKSDKIEYLSYAAEIEESFSNTIKNIDYIVWVLIISAGALAIVVVYNLTNINICERVRELATIKVLGFYDKEVYAYIFRETAILALIGTLFGLLGGIWLHRFVVHTAEVNAVMFGREIYARSFGFAAAMTMAFTGIVDLFMTKRLRKIDMVESMKAVE